MKLSTELLSAFIGGQFEVQNANEEYIFRGEIKDVQVIDGQLSITFNWMAKGEGFPPIPTGWVKDDNLTYNASLWSGNTEIYSVKDIGPGSDGGDSRIRIQSTFIGELGVFYPPNGSKLDPAEVKELDLSVK